MTFLRVAQLPLRKLLVLSGRTSRREFWSYLLAVWVAVVVITLAVRQVSPALVIVLLLPGLVAEYGLLWAVMVRRLHDTNRSGWMLLVSAIPLVGLLVLVAWFATAGGPGANEYGPSPE
jgi:uncharacterized membrane protein YhaH (DUF805 family)